MKQYEEGEPCDHPGCLYHAVTPCEGCGRFAGVDYRKRHFDLKMVVKQYICHINEGPKEGDLFTEWAREKRQLQNLVEKELEK